MSWKRRRYGAVVVLCALMLAIAGGVWLYTSDSRAVAKLADLRRELKQRQAAVAELPSSAPP
jgi:hypothetical protein